MTKIALEHYLTSIQQIYVWIIFIIAVGAFRQSMESLYHIENIMFALLLLLGILLLISLIFAKKGLIVDGDKLYKGLIFADYILYKKPFDLLKYKACTACESSVEYNNVLSSPFLLKYRMFINENVHKIYIINHTNSKTLLMSFHNKESVRYGVEFLTGNTKLELVNYDAG